MSFSLTGSIGHIELCQPPANKMTTEFFLEFDELCDELKSMKGLEAIVISSKGRHFSSGADLDQLLDQVVLSDNRRQGDDPERKSIFERNYRSFLFFDETEIPVVAAIRGVCIGSAFELALLSHFRFCGEDSVFGLPETTFNLVPGLGGIRQLRNLCGQAKAIELALKGSTFGAEEARSLGLVDKIVPRRKVVEFSIDFARKISRNYKKQKRQLYLQQIQQDDPIVS